MSSTEPKKKKKRGRKSKKEKEALLKAQKESNNVIVEKKPKKRGRKPKGGKIIKAENLIKEKNEKQNPNIILHLKCSSKDLNKFDKCALLNNNLNLDTMDINSNNKLDFFELENKDENIKQPKPITYDDDKNINMKLVNDKIKKLKINLRHNNVLYKRASCFWCTYEFDSPAIFITK